MIGYYLTHSQVQIDPSIPVPQWSLSLKGRQRIEASRNKPWLRSLRRIVSSDERKAVETATILAKALDLSVEQRPNMGENDRSATGFITPDKFEAAADAFFAEPDKSWRGWERAIDTQTRIVAAVEATLADHPLDRPVLFVGHGAVGTLLKCQLSARPIARDRDQPGGGGNIYAFDLAERRLLCDWTAIESFDGVSDVR